MSSTRPLIVIGLLIAVAGCPQPTAPTPTPVTKPGEHRMDAKTLERLERALVTKHGAAHKDRIHRGLAQVASRWRAEDGTDKQLAAFAAEHFIVDPAALDDTARHLEYALEMLDGHANEVSRELARFQILAEGPARPLDGLLAAMSPAAHISEDLFLGKAAFVALLNFPITTLEQRVGEGRRWSRREWALARLTERFEHRVPAAVQQEIDKVSSAAESYIDSYNIYCGRLAGAGLPAGLKLISHWGLRDEIRGQYGRKGALPRQQALARVMERIVRQEIPAEVINSGDAEWDVEKNLVRRKGESWREAGREKDVRYDRLLQVFRAMRKADPYFPGYPTHIDRVFALGRELSEARVRQLLTSVLTSPTAKRVTQLIQRRLKRPLQAFDIWYPGFRPAGQLDERALDEITRGRYPTVEHFERDVPRILEELGFSGETARYLGEHVVVDPARGAGHANGAKRREDKAHLRTRVGPNGMDYKGFNIAVHELGHNVEQVFSMSRIDHTLLEGVPNTGFTEAFAFLFQSHDLELLGQTARSDEDEPLRVLDRFWSAFEISGVAILDTEIWHWMVAHPEATPAQLRQATLRLAQEVWNRYFAPVLGVRDAVLLAIYSHIIAYGLYTPDYPLGFLITFQVEQHMKGRSLGKEMERMCRLGRLAPDVWMEQAVGSQLSSAPLLAATDAAVGKLSR